MGRYVVNGEVVDVRQDRPTAGDLKAAVGGVKNDWVMATLPDGRVERVKDARELPAGSSEVAIVPAYEYGG